MECLRCGASILEDGAVFCPECGARLDGKASCPTCGQWIEAKYAYCVFCGAKVNKKNTDKSCNLEQDGAFPPACGTTLAENNEASVSNENGKRRNSTFAWIRAGLGITLTLLSLVFVFMIGFQSFLAGDALAFVEMGLDSDPQTIKLFYYFSDAYKEISSLKEVLLFQSELPIIAAYIHAIMGTVISAATISCVVGFAVPAIINFVKFIITKVENNSGKWAVRSVIAYLAGCTALYVLNFCTLDLHLVIRESLNVGTVLEGVMTIGFDIVTIVGIVLCSVFLALYAIVNYIKRGRAWKSKETVFNCIFGVLTAAFAIVACAVGQNASVGTAITITEGFSQNIKFAMSQLPFSSFLVSFIEPQIFSFFDSPYVSQMNTSYAFALVQEIMMLGVVACSLCAIAARIFETEGKTNGTLLFSILTAAFSIAQLIAGIVSQSIMHNLCGELIAGGSKAVTTTLIVSNAVIALVFAGLQLITSIIHSTIAKIQKS